jgi:hypothetical protein
MNGIPEMKSAGKITAVQNKALKYVAWTEVLRESLNPKIEREMVVGDQIMLARVLLKKGGHVPLHHHVNEQMTYILEGSLKFAIDGQESSAPGLAKQNRRLSPSRKIIAALRGTFSVGRGAQRSGRSAAQLA